MPSSGEDGLDRWSVETSGPDLLAEDFRRTVRSVCRLMRMRFSQLLVSVGGGEDTFGKP